MIAGKERGAGVWGNGEWKLTGKNNTVSEGHVF